MTIKIAAVLTAIAGVVCLLIFKLGGGTEGPVGMQSSPSLLLPAGWALIVMGLVVFAGHLICRARCKVKKP